MHEFNKSMPWRGILGFLVGEIIGGVIFFFGVGAIAPITAVEAFMCGASSAGLGMWIGLWRECMLTTECQPTSADRVVGGAD